MQRLELSTQADGVLKSAAKALLAGGVAIFPTDTVYAVSYTHLTLPTSDLV